MIISADSTDFENVNVKADTKIVNDQGKESQTAVVNKANQSSKTAIRCQPTVLLHGDTITLREEGTPHSYNVADPNQRPED